MRESVWRFCLVCGVVSLCATSSWAVGPTYSLWITGVYEQEFDGGLGEWVWISKCDALICPTQQLPRVCSALTSEPCVTNEDCVGHGNCISIAGPGDIISIEVYLDGWDQDPSLGVCDDQDQTAGCTVGDDATCAALGSSDGKGHHCTLTGTPCYDDDDCNLPSKCDPDVCRPDPLLKTFQWYFDASSFWNYPDPGPDPGLKHADIACLFDEDCACSFDLACSGGPLIQCTCQQVCDETCPDLSTIYFDWGRSDWIFANRLAIMAFNTATPNRQAGAHLQGGSGLPGIVEYDPGPPAREPPYYVGTFVLQVREQNNCGTFRIDFDHADVKTFVQNPDGFNIQPLAVSPATIDLIDFCVEYDVECDVSPLVCHKQWCNPCTAICEDHPDVGGTCDDGDPCTGAISGDKCDESAQCVGRPKVCFDGQFCDPETGECVEGKCEWPQDIISVTPASCAIDARQPHEPENDSELHGWDEWVIEVVEECLPSSENFLPVDFGLSGDPPGIVPLITQVISNDFARRIVVRLADPIAPGRWTCLELFDPDVEPPDPPVVVGKWCLGYLPGDVDGNKTSEGLDIDALIDVLDGVQVLPEHSTDINRSGVRTDGADLLRLIDLLNGAMTYRPWMGETLPRCPG